VIQHLFLSAISALLVSGLLSPTATFDEPTVIVETQSSTSSGDGLPYGPFEPETGDLGSRFTGGWIPLSPSYALSYLGSVQDSGAQVAARFSGGRDRFKHSDGTFDLDKWKARIDNWEGTDIDEFIDDGTILVHFLIDEPKCVECWGGEVIPNDVLDEMAAYSKERWPSLATAVRVSPTWLRDHAGGQNEAWPDWEWTYLDTAWTQYSARKGDILEHAIEENAVAVEQGLGLIVGLNVITGGDGSSGIPSYRSGAWMMSPAELNTYTRTLIDNTSACAFIMWRYDWDDVTYFERPEIRQTMDQLAAYAADSPQGPCSRRDGTGPRFYDLSGTVFAQDILWLAEQGITSGCNPPANDRFCPDKEVTRGQMAAFLARALDLQDDGGGNSFIDDNGSIFEDDIAKIAAAGITSGCNPPVNDRFCPDEEVTRGQMAAFLRRATP